MNRHIVRFTAPAQADVLATYDDHDHLDDELMDWQLLPSSFIDIPPEDPLWAKNNNGKKSVYSGHTISKTNWSVRPLRIICPDYPLVPMVGICPISGTFSTSKRFDSEMTRVEHISCTAFYFD